jgi:hypothetical protein
VRGGANDEALMTNDEPARCERMRWEVKAEDEEDY